MVSLPRGAGDKADMYEISLSYPHVVPILKLCAVPATRAAVEKAFNSRAVPGNVNALERLVALRREAAGLLGYPSHAAYVLEERMATTPETVTSFLESLGRDLAPLLESDLAALQELKTAEEGAASGPVGMADYRYYMERELKDKYAVDHDKIKEYFPLEHVLDRVLYMYQRMLGLRFEQTPTHVTAVTTETAPDPAAESAAALAGNAATDAPAVAEGSIAVWHEEVRAYRVYDAAAGSSTSDQAIGVFYLDLHPRTGKYGHAAVFPLVSGCDAGPVSPSRDETAAKASGRVMPVCAMVCNFTKPTPSSPSLLRHEEVVTLYHELGHVFHHLLSETRLHYFASFRCETDFVEAPSQMLENWCWVPSMLRLLSGHYEDLNKQLPEDMAAKLVESRKAHAGLLNTRQCFLATFDMRLHTLPATESVAESVDTAALLEVLHRDLLRLPMTPGTNFGASFGHLAGGYDSGYYGYLWSEVYAADMFETLFAADPLNPEAGQRYRRGILARGGSQDAKDFLRELLGREPSNKAFLRQKGLPVD